MDGWGAWLLHEAFRDNTKAHEASAPENDAPTTGGISGRCVLILAFVALPAVTTIALLAL